MCLLDSLRVDWTVGYKEIKVFSVLHKRFLRVFGTFDEKNRIRYCEIKPFTL